MLSTLLSPPSRTDVALPQVKKLVELEAVRGIAACVVFNGHFFEGLVPAVSLAVAGTPFAGLFNGPAAVVLFFVLSGFVLTLRPLADGRLAALVSLALRRWPRLAGTVGFAALFYIAAAWLGAFPAAGQVHFTAPPYVYWGEAMHNGNVGDVLFESVAGTFLYGTAVHNGVLWTMHWEFLGSFLSLGLAGVAMMPAPRLVRGALFVLISVAAAGYSPWLAPFPLGVAGALLHLRLGGIFRLSAWPTVALVVAALLLWSWDIRINAGMWSWTAHAMTDQPRVLAWIGAQSMAAVFLMAVALYHPVSRRALGGAAGRLAGRLSFPLYLMHLLVMLTLSAWIIIFAGPGPLGPVAVAALFAVTSAATLAISAPVAWFDVWWVRRLRRVVPVRVAYLFTRRAG